MQSPDTYVDRLHVLRTVLIVTVSHRTFSGQFVNYSLCPTKFILAAIEVILTYVREYI